MKELEHPECLRRSKDVCQINPTLACVFEKKPHHLILSTVEREPRLAPSLSDSRKASPNPQRRRVLATPVATPNSLAQAFGRSSVQKRVSRNYDDVESESSLDCEPGPQPQFSRNVIKLRDGATWIQASSPGKPPCRCALRSGLLIISLAFCDRHMLCKRHCTVRNYLPL